MSNRAEDIKPTTRKNALVLFEGRRLAKLCGGRLVQIEADDPYPSAVQHLQLL
jgi:hypothetical protein